MSWASFKSRALKRGDQWRHAAVRIAPLAEVFWILGLHLSIRLSMRLAIPLAPASLATKSARGIGSTPLLVPTAGGRAVLRSSPELGQSSLLLRNLLRCERRDLTARAWAPSPRCPHRARGLDELGTHLGLSLGQPRSHRRLPLHHGAHVGRDPLQYVWQLLPTSDGNHKRSGGQQMSRRLHTPLLLVRGVLNHNRDRSRLHCLPRPVGFPQIAWR
mmetsp:Transcript_51641/g.115974  ORF Transcript_51641/g.115974 Transcript_51641/m.115974 type:complete len:216 (-) Transcript_51641:411-1058(-)